ncbi:TPA: flagellar motor protein MotB [Pseudomonas aeruginosa]|uniref:OmpA/MotB n=1 Tax=Stutzerimonas stutzeri (strain ATCC 17588 / DSM 5190 / CCUG 11256 / JCM 5965 / LMG 11199 / NBRC 14165 / NCIMB 11358 / Stanier 221) TaxID=96563 RepID=F8GZQ4_STUS2|nr:OmpA family protein [Stutzerimonas stutzeri]AEJ06698.1 OmpA/MotB [Stutzerimonas stutzeri]QPT31547.1 OmpA family protein [Stutzerimonas stutzeri]HCF5566585.1 OmpA family protein [Pseudomonas aeruginosa]
MKDKPNEWVSISDLMAGVMAVVMLLLVMSVLQKTYSDLKHQQELEQSSQSQRDKVSHMLSGLKQTLSGTASEGLVAIDVNAQKFTLRDGVFGRGSACITDQARQAFSSIEEKVADFLNEFPKGKVYVEGHTDNLPVSRPVTNFEAFCTVYDDNFTLSAARAREARKLITGNLTLTDARRVVVAGYGDSQPIPGVPPEDARQRRIEVLWVVQDDND